MIIDLVWNEDYLNYSRKAANNHISNMQKKSKILPDVSDYIKSIIGIGSNLNISQVPKIRCRKTCGGFFCLDI